jgi:hypothetical protein
VFRLDSQAESCEFDPRRPLHFPSVNSQSRIVNLVKKTTVPQNVPQSKTPGPICAGSGALFAITRTAHWFIQQRHKKVECLARLMYRDAETGARKEKSKTAPSVSEAKRRLKELEEEFEIGGQTAIESDLMTFADLVTHCKDARYC